MSARLSITCVIHANKIGGTERVLATLTREWARRGAEVCVMETGPVSRRPFYALDANVSAIRLGLDAHSTGRFAAIVNNIRHIIALRSALRKSHADVVISFLTEQNVVTILAALGTGVPVIVSERTDPYMASKPLMWRVLRWITYRRAARVVVLNQRARVYFEGFSRPEVIPNPVTVMKRFDRRARANIVLGMGRLVDSKKFDVLIDGFAKVAATHSSWRLGLMGDGPERERLEAEVRRHDIADQVRFYGSVSIPDAQLARASIFVSCSVLEGFPMALCEAMAAGLAVVAAEYNGSVREIVEDGWNGLLVDPGDSDATAQAMVKLIEDQDLRIRLGENARVTMQRFRPDTVIGLWDGLFARLGVVPREMADQRHSSSRVH